MMIFGSLCKVDLSTVNWTFWLAILLTKSIIFVIVVIVHAFTNWGKPIGASGLYGIFVTQSNDFALGLPILNALFKTSHPEYLDYLFLLAPISLAILNPIALTIMEISNRKKKLDKEIHNQTNGFSDNGTVSISSVSIETDDRKDEKQIIMDQEIINVNYGSIKCNEDDINVNYRVQEQVGSKISTPVIQNAHEPIRIISTDSLTEHVPAISQYPSTETSVWRTVTSIGCGIFFSPIIFFTIAGLIFGTFVFGGDVPAAVDDFVGTLGDSFAALALFTLGLAMVGKMERFKEGSNLILPLMLVIVKTVLMPIVAFGTTTLLNPGSNANETAEWADFAFIYGTFPTAPTAYVFAAKYEIAPDMIASSVIVCTIVSAPITFVSGN